MKRILITNNPKIEKKYSSNMETIYLENVDLLSVLYYTRDKVHEGFQLLTHPLSGSIKPNQTPYKSILTTGEKITNGIHLDSLKIIEDAITLSCKQISDKKAPAWSEKILSDFQLIDMDLISGAIESVSR